MLDEQQRLTIVMNLGLELSQVKDVDVLLERILTKARQFVNADAGSIYIRDGKTLRFKNTQNETLQKRLDPGKKLIYSSFTVPITNKSISGYVAGNGVTVNIPDVYTLSNEVPYRFDKQYDDLSGYRTHSMLTFPLKTARNEVLGVLQLINAKNDGGTIVPFSKDDEPFLLHFANNAATAIERAEMTRDIILRMIQMAELRDPKETGAHVNRVAAYSVEIYEAWATKKGIPRQQIEKNVDILRMAAMLHDVGKVGISDVVLKKPGRLDPAEYEIMKQHTSLGATLFSNVRSEFDEASCLVALNHHERWDGKGYPGHVNPATGQPVPGYEMPDGKARGKRGEEIPAFGRVVAIADVFDALSCKRVYKEPWNEEKVFETLKSEAGQQFDPEMIEVFFSILDVIRNVSARYPDK